MLDQALGGWPKVSLTKGLNRVPMSCIVIGI